MTDPADLKAGILDALAIKRETPLSQASASGLKMAFNSRVPLAARIDRDAASVWTVTLEDRRPTSRLRANVSSNLAKAVASISREFVTFGRDDAAKLRALDYRRAPLFDEYSRGSVLQFKPQADLEVHGVDFDSSLSARAVNRITNLLPSSAEDEVAVEAIFGARLPSRRAVLEVARAARNAGGLSLEYIQDSDHRVTSVVTAAQAEELRGILSAPRDDVITRKFEGTLDGARSARRQFFLTTENFGDVIGVIEERLVPQVFANLRKTVRITAQETRRSNMAGGRSRPAYLLTSIDPVPESPDLFTV